MPFLKPFVDNIKSPERCNLGVNQAHNFCVGVSVALLNIFLVQCVMPCTRELPIQSYTRPLQRLSWFFSPAAASLQTSCC